MAQVSMTTMVGIMLMHFLLAFVPWIFASNVSPQDVSRELPSGVKVQTVAQQPWAAGTPFLHLGHIYQDVTDHPGNPIVWLGSLGDLGRFSLAFITTDYAILDQSGIWGVAAVLLKLVLALGMALIIITVLIGALSRGVSI